MTSFSRARARSTAITTLLDGRFTDVRLLHASARCTVFGANQAGRPVAIKTPRATDVPWVIESIAREGHILRAVGHEPGVIVLHEQIVLADGRPALVYDLCAGTLQQVTRQPALRSVLALGATLSGALDAVHRAGYLHTDVRPANIYVTSAGGSALGGFSEAIALDPAHAPTHALHATTEHTAPELLEGKPATAATDVYGVAVTLFELLAGHPAFPRYSGEAAAGTGLRILRGTRLALPAHVPIEVADLLGWALSVDPAARPPSPAWLSEELRRIGALIAPRPHR